MNASRFGWGLALAALIAFAAYRSRALTRGGALAAVVVGALTFGGGGWPAAALMVIFFTSASALTGWGRGRKRLADSGYAKGGRRDAAQVIANGGVAAALSLGWGWQGSGLWFAGLAGALAAATADTWATEIGGLARSWPRRITTGQQVPPGTSGAVTLAGLAAAAGGAAWIGAGAGLLGPHPSLTWAVATAGWTGAVFDSILGAAVQAMYFCPACAEETEQFPLHRCGGPTQLRRGWAWLDNDGVNFLSTLFGAGVAAALALTLGG